MPDQSQRDHLFQVCARRCEHCLFTPERLTDGPTAAGIIRRVRGTQVDDPVAQAIGPGAYFLCHEHRMNDGEDDEDAGRTGLQVCCRGFWETFQNQPIPVFLLARMLGNTVFVESDGTISGIDVPSEVALSALLGQYDRPELGLECDGYSRVAATLLARSDIAYTAWRGHVTFGDRLVSPHIWLEVGPLRIDYRLRMWLGDAPDVPHGVFRQGDWPAVQYTGEQFTLLPLNDALFAAMTTPFPDA